MEKSAEKSFWKNLREELTEGINGVNISFAPEGGYDLDKTEQEEKKKCGERKRRGK